MVRIRSACARRSPRNGGRPRRLWVFPALRFLRAPRQSERNIIDASGRHPLTHRVPMKRVCSPPIGPIESSSSRFAGSPPPVFAFSAFSSARLPVVASLARVTSTHAPRATPRTETATTNATRPSVLRPPRIRRPPSASARPSSAHRSRAFDVTAPLSQTHPRRCPPHPTRPTPASPTCTPRSAFPPWRRPRRSAGRTARSSPRYVSWRDPLALHSLHSSRARFVFREFASARFAKSRKRGPSRERVVTKKKPISQKRSLLTLRISTYPLTSRRT